MVESFVAVVKSTASVTSFVTGGGLYETLGMVGDNEYEAAQFALENLGLAQDKRSQVWNVIGHLESAHSAYSKTIGGATTQFRKGALYFTTENACRKEILTASLMATCYLYLQEYDLAKNIMVHAHNAHRKLKSLTKGREMEEPLLQLSAMLTFVNPVQWSAAGEKDTIPVVYPSELEAIDERVRELLQS